MDEQRYNVRCVFRELCAILRLTTVVKDDPCYLIRATRKPFVQKFSNISVTMIGRCVDLCVAHLKITMLISSVRFERPASE